jgi:hypothetical protein
MHHGTRSLSIRHRVRFVGAAAPNPLLSHLPATMMTAFLTHSMTGYTEQIDSSVPSTDHDGTFTHPSIDIMPWIL